MHSLKLTLFFAKVQIGNSLLLSPTGRQAFRFRRGKSQFLSSKSKCPMKSFGFHCEFPTQRLFLAIPDHFWCRDFRLCVRISSIFLCSMCFFVAIKFRIFLDIRGKSSLDEHCIEVFFGSSKLV